MLARGRVDPALWTWLNGRGDYRKEPSTGDRLDSLMDAVSHRSLKRDRSDLWQEFKVLRDARNHFAHTGRAVTGKREDVVSLERARELVGSTLAIVDWIEEGLPADLRRPRWTANGVDLQIVHVLSQSLGPVEPASVPGT